HSPVVPESVRDAAYTPQKHSFISLEGFVNAKVIAEGLRRAGVNPTRAGLRQAFESLRSFDLGIGAPLTFGPERHQGLDSVYFTRVQNERWVPVADWTAATPASRRARAAGVMSSSNRAPRWNVASATILDQCAARPRPTPSVPLRP